MLMLCYRHDGREGDSMNNKQNIIDNNIDFEDMEQKIITNTIKAIKDRYNELLDDLLLELQEAY